MIRDEHNKLNIKRLVLCGILCAIALTIFVVEAQIPLPIALPGIKLGLANTVTLFALIYLTAKEAFAILIIRILLGAVFTGQPSIILYSLSGGIACLLFEVILLKLLGKKYICEISVVGAMVHNTVQVLCAALITGTFTVFYYLPLLLIAAIITGAFCGMCVYLTDKKISKLNRKGVYNDKSD